jgi:hypothetical protein
LEEYRDKLSPKFSKTEVPYYFVKNVVRILIPFVTKFLGDNYKMIDIVPSFIMELPDTSEDCWHDAVMEQEDEIGR